MQEANLKDKKCVDCGRIITFEDFCRINPFFSLKCANELWNNPLITPYCSKCYFNRPEKPFKLRTRYYSFYNRFRE